MYVLYGVKSEIAQCNIQSCIKCEQLFYPYSGNWSQDEFTQWFIYCVEERTAHD